MTIKLRLIVLALLCAFGSTALVAQTQSVDLKPGQTALRGATPLDQEAAPPRLPNTRNSTEREVRNYPEQPPLIPHTIDGYQVDLNGNKCLSCHARARTGESQAPMISITHFMDRDGQFLATVSPRRFFCTQCHVSQADNTRPPVDNTFVDIDTLVTRTQPGGKR